MYGARGRRLRPGRQSGSSRRRGGGRRRRRCRRGSPAGKGGFKLSLFGYEPELDHQAITREQSGKRINLKDPAKSLLLQKSTAAAPHAGGQRFKVDGPEYRTLLAWLKEGAPGIGE